MLLSQPEHKVPLLGLRVCVCLYLQLLLQLRILLLQTLIDSLQVCGSLVLAEICGCVELIIKDLVLYLVGLELLCQIHLTNLKLKKNNKMKKTLKFSQIISTQQCKGSTRAQNVNARVVTSANLPAVTTIRTSIVTERNDLVHEVKASH